MAKGVQANWNHRGAPRPVNPVRRHPAKSVWTRVRMIMIFLFYVLSLLKGKRLTTFCASLRSGGRRLAVRTAMEHPIGTLPRTPFCHYVAFPLKGKRGTWREKQASHILHVPFRCFLLWWLSLPPCPVGSMSYDTESKSRNADYIFIAR